SSGLFETDENCPNNFPISSHSAIPFIRRTSPINGRENAQHFGAPVHRSVMPTLEIALKRQDPELLLHRE
ncbi:hypothetical protein RZS08_46345, partial [Arthrospira platensis SPKY1]|nr:hypothetical protein [Arthrospira platensis SPKY1]